MFILRRKGGITANALAKTCKARCFKFQSKINWNDFVINYGEQTPNAHLNNKVNFDKVRVQKLLENYDIRMPELYSKNETIENIKFPVLARKNFHSKGRDIIYIKDKNALINLRSSGRSYDFLVKYIDKVSEYRVHILKGFTSFVSVKVNDEEDRNEIVRNRNKGWKQIEYDGEFKNSLIKLSDKVMDVLKYDFGAIDIIRDENNKLYVLEVNSAPGLEERKLKIYANYFIKKEKEWKSKLYV